MIDFKLPFLGEGIKSAGVVKLLVSEGQTITAEQPVLEVETDKAAIEVPSSVGGKITKIHVQAGSKVDVGAVVLTLDDGGAEKPAGEPAPVAEAPKPVEKPRAPEAPAPKPAPAPAPPPARPETMREVAPASPSVRRFAREIGIDIMKVPGSGPAGRISAEDVKAYAREAKPSAAAKDAAPPADTNLPDFSKWGQVESAPMSTIRAKTAEHLANAWRTIPHVTHFDKADVTDLEKLRQRFAKKADSAGGKLTVTAMVIKVVASALKVFPNFNASLDGQNIITKKYINIGVAVDTERGLLVPVLRSPDQMNIMEISKTLNEIADRARNKKTTLDEMQGGTFTITNLGGIGGIGFTPIINAPEVAILGISRSNIEPVWKDGKFEPREKLPLSLSYDHRVIDGADAARFLKWIVDALEQPFLITLEG